MATRDLLIEIGLEEMPARFVRGGMDQLKDRVSAWLQDKRIAFSEAQALATPRRLALLVKGVAETQEAKSEWVKGPALKVSKNADGQWTPAALGFARSQGVSPEQFEVRLLNGVEYLYALKEESGQATAGLLADALAGLISGMTFPKNMRWSTHDLKFLRPIRWLVGLYGQEVIPFEITNVKSGNQTLGHRYLGAEVSITSAADYIELLRKQFVIVDPVERQQLIENQLKELASQNGWTIPIDEDLLEEVLFLVEYPTALSGQFEERFLRVPKEVLITSMREHQRYFPVLNANGELMPRFVTVRNGDSNSLELVARGNEKVLRARLSDAVFFYEEDQKKTIDACNAKLDAIIQQEQLGTLGDKVRRVSTSASKLANQYQDDATTSHLARAAAICKFDLVTSMVYEFTELQGLMGEHYALQKGEAPVVAQAIREHYMPKNASDSLPQSAAGTLLSIADKADNLVGCFFLNIIPTGSQDPYGLRRQAAGIVQMLADGKYAFTLSEIFEAAWSGFVEAKGSKTLLLDAEAKQRTYGAWQSFFTLRLKTALDERGVRYDISDAILTNPVEDVSVLFARAQALADALSEGEESFKPAVDAWTRVCNLAGKAQTRVELQGVKWQNAAETALYEAYLQQKDAIQQAVLQAKPQEAIAALRTWVQPINQFFDQVMVMVDDEAVRNQRLTLLALLANSIQEVADFGKLVWGGGQ